MRTWTKQLLLYGFKPVPLVIFRKRSVSLLAVQAMNFIFILEDSFFFFITQFNLRDSSNMIVTLCDYKGGFPCVGLEDSYTKYI